MASKTGRYVVQNELKHLIFSDTHLTANICTLVFNDLLRDVNQISRILSDTTILSMFLSNFDGYAERISQFFRQVDGGPSSAQAKRNVYVGPDLPDVLISGFLLRLLDDGFNRFQTEPSYHGLFSSIINFCLTFSSAQLGMLAKALGEKEQPLESLVSGEVSGQVMRKWIHAFDMGSPLLESGIFAAWVKRLITLCGRCGNHLVSEQFGIWRKLQGLIDRLAEVQSTFTSTSEKAKKEITQGDKDLLADFGIAPPASERALQNVLEKLRRDETVKVLRVLADSFPCRGCYIALTGDVIAEEEFRTEQRTAVPLSFTGLFGSNLGIWRISVSAQALKDLRQSQSEGGSRKCPTDSLEFAYAEIYR